MDTRFDSLVADPQTAVAAAGRDLGDGSFEEYQV